MQIDNTRDKLLRLLSQGKKYMQSELAKELGVRQSAISKQLKCMEKRDWVMGLPTTATLSDRQKKFLYKRYGDGDYSKFLNINILIFKAKLSRDWYYRKEYVTNRIY